MSDDIANGPWPDPPANPSPGMPQVQARKPDPPARQSVKSAGAPVNTANLARVAIRPPHS